MRFLKKQVGISVMPILHRAFPLSLAALTLPAPAIAADIATQRELAVRVFHEKMGEGRFDRLDEIYAPGFVARTPDGDVNLEEDNASGREWRRAFPDLRVSVLRTVAEGDQVAVHWHASGTNSVAAAGLPGKGKRAEIDGMTFFRFRDGRIAEEWSVIDIARMMRQLAD